MIEALERAGIEGFMLKLIKMMYCEPKFKVKGEKGESQYYEQRAGIGRAARCRLSFLLAHSLVLINRHDFIK